MSDTEPRILILGDGSPLNVSVPNSQTESDYDSETGSSSSGTQTEEEIEAEKESLRAELLPLTPKEQAEVDAAKAQEANAPPPTGANETTYVATDDNAGTSYQSDLMKASVSRYDSIKVQRSVDKYGRHFFMFDDGKSVNLLIMIFTTAVGEMLCINDTIMPLQEFLSITHARPAPKSAQLQGNTGGDVLCKISDSDEWFIIQNTTVNQVMTALLYLTNEQTEPQEQQEQQQQQQYGEWPGVIRMLWRLLW